jgi:uncharacterized protein YgbK (DUF1537 family)
LVVLKGGVTSAVCLQDSFEAQSAIVRGPVLPGVALWELAERSVRCLVVPGNVGSETTLVDLVEEALVR